MGAACFGLRCRSHRSRRLWKGPNMEARSVRILLVEDNPDHAFITRRAIQTAHAEGLAGFELDHVEDGESALDYLFRRGQFGAAPRPDLILLDLQLPAKSGF